MSKNNPYLENKCKILCKLSNILHAKVFKCFDEFLAPTPSLQSEATMFSD